MRMLWVFAVVLAIHLLAVVYLLVPRGGSSDDPDRNDGQASAEQGNNEEETNSNEPENAEPEEPEEPEYATYQVQRGDSLTVIARRHGTTLSEILRLNDLTSDTVIHPGQELIVPAVPEDGE